MATDEANAIFPGTVDANWSVMSDPRVLQFDPQVVNVEFEEGANPRTVGARFTVRYNTGESRVCILDALDDNSRSVSWSLYGREEGSASADVPFETDALRTRLELISLRETNETFVRFFTSVGRGCTDSLFKFIVANAQQYLTEMRATISGRQELTKSTVKRARENDDE